MTTCSLLSYIAIAWMKMVPMQTIRSRVQFFKISALSLVFCVSVVFGNISLRYLPVSFNQAVGATTPFFTAVFAYLMTLKREAWLTYITLVPVVTGVIIATFVLIDSFLRGFLEDFIGIWKLALLYFVQNGYFTIGTCGYDLHVPKNLKGPCSDTFLYPVAIEFKKLSVERTNLFA
ncbi:putative sugar phosphate/phosphate translocator [Hibiscus syriacus]|uniref:Sugar phosphate/phosphate translocator n=1 Tax=Hibiscus syriacus TaxID=106335 RepID=A0A6A2ZFA0_HIBSY|nr:putative sugar phosphate/phosphate translocator [Hibiscus syriacus]